MLALVGMPGSGKSTVGRQLARKLGVGFVDCDQVIEMRIACPIKDYFARQGEAAFRDIETQVIDDMTRTACGVLATGGGVVLRQHNRELLHSAGRPTVWLTASAEVVRSRLALDPTTAQRRPALSGTDPLAEVASALEAREPLYRECADLIIDTHSATADQAARAIIDWLENQWPSTAAPLAEEPIG